LIQGSINFNNFPRVILNHGTIENARVAVNGMNRILLLADNQFTFLNNKIGIKLSSHKGTNFSSIKNCIFKTDNDLFDVAWDVPLMDGTLDEIRGQSNQFAGHRYFIHLQNLSNIPIFDNTFESEKPFTKNYMGEGIHLEGTNTLIKGNTFKNQRNAISIYDGYTKLGASRIIDNMFNGNLTAIAIEGSNLVKIEENSINIESLTLGSDYNFGVRIISSSGIQILNNEFTSDFDSNIFFIAGNDTNDALTSEIKYNSFGSNDKVAYRAIELQGDHSMLQLFCNDFTMTSDVEFAIGLENGAILMNQGRSDAPAGNDWSNLGECINAVNNESQIYKSVTASDFLYHAYFNTTPDCVSIGIEVEVNTNSQPLTHCEVPSDPDCGGTFPRVCDFAMILNLQDTYNLLTTSPNLSKPQAEREAEIRYIEHQLLSIVQSNIIDKITEDSIDQVLIYLDTIKSFSPALGDIHDAILDKYTEPLLRPTTTNDYSYFHNLSTFIPRSTIPNKFVPLSKEVNNIHEKETEKEIDTKDVEIQIFPNPTDGQAIIELINGEKNNVSLKSISIYNALGQQLNILEANNSQSIQVNVTSYDVGMYFIQVKDSNNQSYVKKLIIQK